MSDPNICPSVAESSISDFASAQVSILAHINRGTLLTRHPYLGGLGGLSLRRWACYSCKNTAAYYSVRRVTGTGIHKCD